MSPAHNPLRRQYQRHGGGQHSFAEFNQQKASLVVPSMAQEEEEEEEEEEEGQDFGSSSSTSKTVGGDDPFKGWLRLGIGGMDPAMTMTASAHVRSLHELNLFPPEIRPPPILLPTNPNFHPMPVWGPRGPAAVGSMELRVVSPPARQQTGLWFELKAAQNQGKQPFLPQIPKSYLRIKDGRMTIRLLMKYLANKLGLVDESQVEISCRGQHLHPALTLQYIRDNVWCAMPTVTLMSLNLPATDRVMILHYATRDG